MKDLFFIVHHKGGCFFGMKRAEAAVVPAGGLEGHRLTHHRHNGKAILDLLQERGWEHSDLSC
jgi:hypothetical protein